MLSQIKKPIFPMAKPPVVMKGSAPKMPTAPKAAAPKAAATKTAVQKPAPRPVVKAVPRPAPAPAPAASQPAGNTVIPANVAAPKLGNLPVANLPGMSNRFVAVRLSVSVPNNARQSRKIVERNAAQGGASTNAAKASVVLFDPKHLDEIRNIRQNVTAMLNDIGLKTSDGCWIVHASRSKQLIEIGVNAEQAYRESARSFVDSYEDYCQEWSNNLGDDFDPKLYPPVEKVATQMGVNIGQQLGATQRKRGFVFSMNAISDHDESLEKEMGLSLSDDERAFVAESARAHYQGVVDQAFGQLQEAMKKIVESEQPGRRLRKATVDAANDIARKIEEMGIDTSGVAARAKAATAEYAPVRSGVNQSATVTEKRTAYMNRAAAVLADLQSLGDSAASDE